MIPTRRGMLTLLVPMALVIGLPLGSCGGNDPASTAVTTTSDATKGNASATTTGSQEGSGTDAAPSIVIVDFAFSPSQGTFPVGTTVTVRNEDQAAHTFTAGTINNPDGSFNLQLAGGASDDITLDEEGDFSYFCAIHPGMKGTLEVTA